MIVDFWIRLNDCTSANIMHRHNFGYHDAMPSHLLHPSVASLLWWFVLFEKLHCLHCATRYSGIGATVMCDTSFPETAIRLARFRLRLGFMCLELKCASTFHVQNNWSTAFTYLRFSHNHRRNLLTII